MTLRIPFANDAKQYDFGYLRHLAETLLNSEGVANYTTDFVVTNAATGLRVDIAAGAAWVKGDSGTPAMGISQGLFSVVNDAAVTNAVTLPAAHATNPRLDQIVLKVRDSADLGSGADDAIFDYVQGTATAGATLLNRTGAAALPNDCLLLADVLVPATATNLTATNVRDRRIPANGRAMRSIPTTETTTSTSYVDLATPDAVELYVPADATVQLMRRFFAKRSVSNGGCALFITDLATMTAAQPKRINNSVGGNQHITVGELVIDAPTYHELFGANSAVATTDQTLVTTGIALDMSGNSLFHLHGLPAGLYRFSALYKAGAGGTTSVRDRFTQAAVMGHGRSA